MNPKQRATAERLVADQSSSNLEWSRQVVALLRELAAEPVQEPVAWLYESASGSSFLHRGFTNVRFEADMRASKEYPDGHKMTPLYIHPPQQRKPLSDEQIYAAISDQVFWATSKNFIVRVVRDVEAAHGITGGKE